MPGGRKSCQCYHVIVCCSSEIPGAPLGSHWIRPCCQCHFRGWGRFINELTGRPCRRVPSGGRLPSLFPSPPPPLAPRDGVGRGISIRSPWYGACGGRGYEWKAGDTPSLIAASCRPITTRKQKDVKQLTASGAARRPALQESQPSNAPASACRTRCRVIAGRVTLHVSYLLVKYQELFLGFLGSRSVQQRQTLGA